MEKKTGKLEFSNREGNDIFILFAWGSSSTTVSASQNGRRRRNYVAIAGETALPVCRRQNPDVFGIHMAENLTPLQQEWWNTLDAVQRNRFMEGLPNEGVVDPPGRNEQMPDPGGHNGYVAWLAAERGIIIV